MSISASIIISIVVSIFVTLLIWGIQSATYNNYGYRISPWLLIIIGVLIAFFIYFIIGVIGRSFSKNKRNTYSTIKTDVDKPIYNNVYISPDIL